MDRIVKPSRAKITTVLIADLKEEIAKANIVHGDIHSLHEGYGVLSEEVAELFDEVRRKDFERVPQSIVNECIQIAAVAIRIAITQKWKG